MIGVRVFAKDVVVQFLLLSKRECWLRAPLSGTRGQHPGKRLRLWRSFFEKNASWLACGTIKNFAVTDLPFRIILGNA